MGVTSSISRRVGIRALPAAAALLSMNLAAAGQSEAPGVTEELSRTIADFFSGDAEVEIVSVAPQVDASHVPGLDAIEDESVTEHSITLNGRELRYTATAGMLPLLTEQGEKQADIFFIAYTVDPQQPDVQRPLTFVFNGGPGSSSVWLHLGMYGPRRVEMGDAGDLLPPPWGLVDNEATLLDVTDLVFIDPVTTGYSRAAEGVDAGDFHGLEEDIRAVAEFVRRYLTEFERWGAAKFLAGESYGTTRAAGLAQHLQDEHGIFLNGVTLISSILDFGTTRWATNNDLPYILFLPSYAATAWYHGELPEDLQARDIEEVLAEVEAFALGPYASALLRGTDLDADAQSRIASALARYTGLPAELIEDSNLRVDLSRFGKALLREEDRTIGRLDSRFTGIDRETAGDRYSYDASYSAIHGPYTAALNQYVREELEYRNPIKYEILTGRVHPWNYGRRSGYPDVAERLREAMTENPALQVFIASGYYDLATPYFAADYTASHLMLDESLRDHLRTRYYRAGHMMYVHPESRWALREDLAEFYRDATPRTGP